MAFVVLNHEPYMVDASYQCTATADEMRRLGIEETPRYADQPDTRPPPYSQDGIFRAADWPSQP